MKKDRSFAVRPIESSKLDLKGTRVAIVGGTGGLGRALSRFMASRGAQVIVVGQTFRDQGVPGIEFVEADLSSMREAKRVGEALPAESLDVVVFTTGIFAAPERQETAEGLERDMAVSYLSRLVILRGIAPRLRRRESGAKPRVFVMGFPGSGQVGTLEDLNAEKSYRAMGVHMNTVAGNEMLVLDAVKRYPHVSFFGLNPGLVRTAIRDNFLGAGTLKSRVAEWLIGLLNPSAEQYADRVGPLLVSPDLEGHSGAMFDRKGEPIAASPGLTEAHVHAFLTASEGLVTRVLGVGREADEANHTTWS